jgi:hypothetical protein
MTVAGIRYARRFYTGHIHIEYASLLAFFSPDFKRTFYSAFVKLDVLFYPEAASRCVQVGYWGKDMSLDYYTTVQGSGWPAQLGIRDWAGLKRHIDDRNLACSMASE